MVVVMVGEVVVMVGEVMMGEVAVVVGEVVMMGEVVVKQIILDPDRLDPDHFPRYVGKYLFLIQKTFFYYLQLSLKKTIRIISEFN